MSSLLAHHSARRFVLLVCVLPSCTGDAYLGSQPVAAALTPMAADASVAPAAMPTDSSIANPMSAVAVSHAPDAAAPNIGVSLQVRRDSAPISELRLQCPERCAPLELAADGGTPPYVYSWDDGANTALRVLCPRLEVPLVVTVRDALGAAASVELPVSLEACRVETVCLANPTFEGMPTFGAEWLGNAALSASGWNDCRGSNASPRSLPRVVNAASGDDFPAATDGSTYLYLPTHEEQHGLVEQMLCTPLERGGVYYLKLDLAYAAEDSAGAPLEPGQFEIYGADDACGRSELLWASPPLHTALRTYCVALQPSAGHSRLVLSPTADPARDSAVFVDHLMPVSSCP